MTTDMVVASFLKDLMDKYSVPIPVQEEEMPQKLYEVNVQETFYHHVYVFAESVDDAENKVFDILDDNPDKPLTNNGVRMDRYTKVEAVGSVGPPPYDVWSGAILNSKDDDSEEEGD